MVLEIGDDAVSKADEAGAERYSVPPVERAIVLLRHIGAGNRVRNLSKTAKELGINRTTLTRLIHTLVANRMIEEIEEGAGYRLGLGLIGLATQAIHSRDIVRVSQSVLPGLAARIGLSAHMGVLDGREIVYLALEVPNTHLVSNMHAGSRLPAHTTSIGRAILAEMEAGEIVALFGGGDLEAVTEKSPVTLGQLLDQAREDRQRGFTWSAGNFETGIGSCGAVVLDHNGKAAGGLNVSGPEDLFTDIDSEGARAIQAAVLAAAAEASEALGYSGARY